MKTSMNQGRRWTARIEIRVLMSFFLILYTFEVSWVTGVYAASDTISARAKAGSLNSRTAEGSVQKDLNTVAKDLSLVDGEVLIPKCPRIGGRGRRFGTPRIEGGIRWIPVTPLFPDFSDSVGDELDRVEAELDAIPDPVFTEDEPEQTPRKRSPVIPLKPVKRKPSAAGLLDGSQGMVNEGLPDSDTTGTADDQPQKRFADPLLDGTADDLLDRYPDSNLVNRVRQNPGAGIINVISQPSSPAAPVGVVTIPMTVLITLVCGVVLLAADKGYEWYTSPTSQQKEQAAQIAAQIAVHNAAIQVETARQADCLAKAEAKQAKAKQKRKEARQKHREAAGMLSQAAQKERLATESRNPELQKSFTDRVRDLELLSNELENEANKLDSQAAELEKAAAEFQSQADAAAANIEINTRIRDELAVPKK